MINRESYIPSAEIKEYYDFLRETQAKKSSPANIQKFVDQKFPDPKPEDSKISKWVIPIFAGLSTGTSTFIVISFFISPLVGIPIGLTAGIITCLALARILQSPAKNEEYLLKGTKDREKKSLTFKIENWIAKERELQLKIDETGRWIEYHESQFRTFKNLEDLDALNRYSQQLGSLMKAKTNFVI